MKYELRAFGAPYAADGECVSTPPTQQQAGQDAQRILQPGQRAELLHGTQVVARYLYWNVEDRVVRIAL